jgi:hypothetical protein
MSNYNPLSAIPPSRKRKPAQKLIDENNVATPMLKRQRLTFEQQRPEGQSSHCVPDPMERRDSNPPSNSILPLSPSAPATVIVSTDDEDEEDMEDILTEFVPKKRGDRKALKKKELEGETAEEELSE